MMDEKFSIESHAKEWAEMLRHDDTVFNIVVPQPSSAPSSVSSH